MEAYFVFFSVRYFHISKFLSEISVAMTIVKTLPRAYRHIRSGLSQLFIDGKVHCKISLMFSICRLSFSINHFDVHVSEASYLTPTVIVETS